MIIKKRKGIDMTNEIIDNLNRQNYLTVIL